MIHLPSHAGFSELIGRIYDCVLDPASWGTVLDEIRAEVGFVNAVLAINSLGGSADFFASARMVHEELKPTADRYGLEIIAMWGGSRIRHYPMGEPIVLSRVCSIETIRQSRYHREWCRPRNWGDALAIRVTDDPVSYGNVTFGQPDSSGLVDEDQVDAMRLLAPHLRRAVAISNILDHKAVEAATFAGTVDALLSAVVLVDEDCGVVYSNPAARTMLAAGGPLQSRHRSVTVADEMARRALAGAVRQAALDEARMGERGLGIPVQGPAGDPAVIHVLPLMRGPFRPGLARRAVAALFVNPASGPPQMHRNALVLLYELTPAEVRVCEMVSEGAPPADIARSLGVSINTIRTHLSHVFEKTGTKRQADLIRLLASLARPV